MRTDHQRRRTIPAYTRVIRPEPCFVAALHGRYPPSACAPRPAACLRYHHRLLRRTPSPAREIPTRIVRPPHPASSASTDFHAVQPPPCTPSGASYITLSPCRSSFVACHSSTLRARIPGVEFSLQDPPCTVNRSRPALRGSSIFTAPALACCHPRRAAFPSPTLVLGAPKFGPQSRWRRLAHRARSQEPLLASTPCERPSQYTSPLTRSTSTRYPLSDIRSPAVIPAHRPCPGQSPSSRPPLLQCGFPAAGIIPRSAQRYPPYVYPSLPHACVV